MFPVEDSEILEQVIKIWLFFLLPLMLLLLQVARVVVEGEVSGRPDYDEQGGRRGYEPENYSRLLCDREEEEEEELR